MSAFRDPCVGEDGRPLPDVRNLRLVLEYDGRCFSGWQRQPGVRTVQQVLEDLLTSVLRHTTVVRGAGRTDSGVHAWAQVANVFTHSTLPVERIRRAIDALAGPGLRAISVDDAERLWDARRNALGKRYAYHLVLRTSALREGRAWILQRGLDVDRLARELESVPALCDWSAYRAADCTAPDPVKALWRARLLPEPREEWRIVFEGEGFLKQQVRAMVGTLVEVAQGRRPPGDFGEIRESRDRRRGGSTAPAEGLYLEQVYYDVADLPPGAKAAPR